MPANEAGVEWIKGALTEYLADREAALEAAASAIGGAQVVQESLDEWAYRTDDVRQIYARTAFVCQRVLARQPITPQALDIAWPGEHVPPLDDDPEMVAAAQLGASIRDYLAAKDETDLDQAIDAVGGMGQVRAAIADWAAGQSQPAPTNRVIFILDRVMARQPIDLDSLQAAWSES